MARKPTKAELRKALLQSDWSAAEAEDPRVQRIRERLKLQEEEQAKAAAQKKSFSNVETGSSTYVPTAGRTSLDRMGDAFTGGMADIASDTMYQDVDATAREKLRKAAQEKTIKESILPEPLARVAHTDLLSPLANRLGGLMGDTEAYQSGMKGLSKYSEDKRAAVEAEVRENIERNPIRGRIERTFLDVAGSPQSLASIPGGAFAAIPAMTTYNDAYRKMREGGATPEEAKAYATAQAGVEGGISAIPAAKFLGTIAKPFMKAGARPITAPIRSSLGEVAVRTGKTALGETAEEMTQTVAADLVNRATALTGDTTAGREVASQAISKDLLNDTLRAGAAGFVGGGGLGSVHSSLQVAKENAQLAAAANRRLNADLSARERMNAANARMADKPQDTSIPAAKDPIAMASVGKSSTLAPPSKKKVAQDAAEAKRKAEEAELRAFAGGGTTQAQQAAAGPSAARQLVQNLTNNRGSADAKRALSLLASGRLEILNDMSEIGVQAKPGQVIRGMEEGGKMYINAAAFDPKQDLAPQLAATVFHETKHAADFGQGDVQIPKNLAGFIGMENAAPINRKIEQAAERGNKIAQQAVERAQANGVYEEELVPHFISETKLARNKASGMANVMGDIRNAVKSQYNSIFGNQEGVSVDDVFKLSQQLTDYVAQNQSFNTQPKEPGGTPQREMIVGKKATGFPFAQELGLTYQSKDGGEKYYISDKNSDLNLSSAVISDIKTNPHPTPIPLGRILKHNDLFSEYPKLKNVPVVFKEMDPKVHGAAGNGRIEINSLHVNDGKFNSGTHRVLLHEVQHIIQEMEGTSGGSSPELHLPPEYEKNKAKEQGIMTAFQNFVRDAQNGSFKKYGINPETAPNPEEIRAITEEAKNAALVAKDPRDRPIPDDYALEAAVEALTILSKSPATNTQTIKYLVEKGAELINLMDINEATEREAFRDYQKNLGEHEARYTERNIDMPEDEAPIDPETIYYPDATTDGGVNPIKPRAMAVPSNPKVTLRKSEGRVFADVEVGGRKYTKETTFDSTYDAEQWAQKEFKGTAEIAFKQSPSRQMAVPSSNGEIAQERNGKGVKAFKTIKGLFSAFGELGRDLGVRAEEAVGEASYFADLAQTTSLRIKRGTKQAAARLLREGGASSLTDAKAKINARIKGTLDSLIGIEEEGRRQSAIAALVREHPELAAIQDGYNMINDGTRQIVKQMLASKTGPLTDAEIKKMKTLITNQTRYLTRAYAAFQGGDGKTWSSKLENEYAIAKAMVAEGKPIPAKYKDSYERYKNALDFVIRENVAVFNEEELGEMTLDKVRMVYDTWFSNRQGVEDEFKRTNDKDAKVKDHLIEAIVAKGEQVNAKQIENRAHKIVNGLLGLNETSNPLVSYYRGFKQDRSILMDRDDMPQELKELFGEIEDPSLRIMLTIAKQGELVARTNLLLGIKNDLYGKKIVSNEDKADDANDTFSQQLSGQNWGPLEGHWVTPEVWSTIRDDREIATNMEDAIGRLVLDANAVNSKWPVKAASYYTRLAGLQKVAAIVWNPAQTIWNFGGSWISGIKEGNVNPKNYARAGKAAAKLFAKEMQAAGAGGRILENDPDVEDLIRYDVIDSAMVQEIRKLPSQYIRQIINDHGHVRNVLTKGRDISFAAVKQIFALSDLTVKIANYYNEVNHLEAYYKAEGIEKSPETIKKEAANTIKDTNITFRRAAPIVKMTERAGMSYVLPYIQGVFRSAIYGYVHGMKSLVRGVNEAKTVKGKAIMAKQGFGRIIGSTTAIFLIQAMARSVLTGDDEKDKKIRQIQMLDARYADSTYVGDDAKGNPMMLRWSRFDPLGPLTDLVRIVSSDATPEQKNRDMAQHMHDLFIKPRLGQELAKLAVEFITDDKEAAVKTKETKLERIFPQATQATKDFIDSDFAPTDYADAQAFMGVLDTMLPGASNIIDPNNVSPTEWKAKDGDEAAAKFLLAMGGRLDTINPVTSAIGAVKDLDAVRKEARERVFEKLKTTDPTDRDAMKGIMDLMDDERKAFIRVKEVYEGMKALDMTKSQIDEVLSDKANLSAHDRHLLYSGKYDTSLEGWKTKGSSVLSKKSIDPRTKTSGDKNPDPKEAAKEKEAIKKAVKALRDLGYKVKE